MTGKIILGGCTSPRWPWLDKALKARTGWGVVWAVLLGVVALAVSFPFGEERKDDWRMEIIRQDHPNYYAYKERQQEEHSPKDTRIDDIVAGADAVVLGVVKAIEGHPEGPYHTWIRIRTDKCYKGCIGESEIFVKRCTGPVWLQKNGMRLQGGSSSTGDAEYLVGERMVFFLTTVPSQLWEHGRSISQSRLLRHDILTWDIQCLSKLKEYGGKPFQNIRRTNPGSFEVMAHYRVEKDKIAAGRGGCLILIEKDRVTSGSENLPLPLEKRDVTEFLQKIDKAVANERGAKS